LWRDSNAFATGILYQSIFQWPRFPECGSVATNAANNGLETSLALAPATISGVQIPLAPFREAGRTAHSRAVDRHGDCRIWGMIDQLANGRSGVSACMVRKWHRMNKEHIMTQDNECGGGVRPNRSLMSQ